MSEEDRISLARLEEKVTQWMSTTTEYRLSLCEKIGHITERLDNLPCSERKLGTKLVWAALGILGALLFTHLGWK